MKLNYSLISLLCLLSCLLPGCRKEQLPPDFYQELRSTNRMVFASMAVTKTAGLNSDWKAPGTKRIALYSYDTYLEAYIDLNELRPDDVSIDQENHTVSIQLPPIRTEIAGRDFEMRKEYDNVGVFRRNPDSKERAQIKEIANRQLKKEVEENRAFRRQLVTAARHKAEAYFTALMARQGYTAEISFR